MTKKVKLLYLAPNKATFVKKDLQFLEERYQVIYAEHDWRDKKTLPWRFIQQFFFLLKHLPKTKVVMIMFAGYWSLVPALLGRISGKRIHIILGGTEAVSYPSFHYGSLRKPLWRFFIGNSYKLAHHIIPVHESLALYHDEYYDQSMQGYQHFYPKVKAICTTIYNGYEADRFKIDLSRKQKNTFVCTAYVPNEMNFLRKGIDLLFVLARHYPQANFKIIGFHPAYQATRNDIPKNVECLPPLSQEDFFDTLIETEYCLQLSISEGFPNGICEAMLSGCIPIGSAANGIPIIIGETGLVLKHKNEQLLLDEFAALYAMNAAEKESLALAARKRIETVFPLSKRAQEFYQLIDSDLNENA
jgi:glycosyltransferase involved in cell wall biosynthesis